MLAKPSTHRGEARYAVKRRDSSRVEFVIAVSVVTLSAPAMEPTA